MLDEAIAKAPALVVSQLEGWYETSLACLHETRLQPVHSTSAVLAICQAGS